MKSPQHVFKRYRKAHAAYRIAQYAICICTIAITSAITATTVDHHTAYGHSMFNSAEEFMAGYRVQVATAPEFPQIDEPSMFLVKVTDTDFEEVDRFTMGIRFFFNDQQIDAVPPTSIEGGHWDFVHVWRYQGNHIVKVDLYDLPDKPGVTTYTFNMGTQSPFGYIFIIAITVGAMCFAGVMMYIYLPGLLNSNRHHKKGSRHSFDR